MDIISITISIGIGMHHTGRYIILYEKRELIASAPLNGILFLLQVLLGLEFLHRNRQMHRDIKPGNILLNCNGEVKLADFGISKAVDTKSGFNQPNSFVGTMCYMVSEAGSMGYLTTSMLCLSYIYSLHGV